MAKIDRMLVGESLVGDGNEVAHIDLIIGPRGSAAETAFANCLTKTRTASPRCWPWSRRTCCASRRP
jgi:hypothetical protein